MKIITPLFYILIVTSCFSQSIKIDSTGSKDSLGLKQGKWTCYIDKKIRRELNYVNDTLHGTYKSFYSSEKLATRGYFHMGRKIKHENFSKDGKRSDVVIKDFNGNVKYLCTYDNEGKMQMQTMYFIDKEGRKAVYEIYYKNGVIEYEGGASRWKHGMFLDK